MRLARSLGEGSPFHRRDGIGDEVENGLTIRALGANSKNALRPRGSCRISSALFVQRNGFAVSLLRTAYARRVVSNSATLR